MDEKIVAQDGNDNIVFFCIYFFIQTMFPQFLFINNF